MDVHYEIVKHKGDWAVKIGDTIYDDPQLFERDYPKDQHTATRFSSCEDMDFSWEEMHGDMIRQWC